MDCDNAVIFLVIVSLYSCMCRVNLVVTEIVDAGLLGEYIIPTLRHAWKELLLPCKADMETGQASNQTTPRGHVIPCGSIVHVIIIILVIILLLYYNTR
jgi:type II protein arginine methyltransferase